MSSLMTSRSSLSCISTSFIQMYCIFMYKLCLCTCENYHLNHFFTFLYVSSVKEHGISTVKSNACALTEAEWNLNGASRLCWNSSKGQCNDQTSIFHCSRSQGARSSPSMHWARGRKTPWTGLQSKTQTSLLSSTCSTEMPEDVSPRSHTSCAVR